MSLHQPSSDHARRTVAVAAALGLATALSSCALAAGNPTTVEQHAVAVRPEPGPAPARSTVPRPKHVVIVVFENERAGDIIGNPQAPYINRLANTGASFTKSFALTHPSQPNYLALFSGSTQGVRNDDCQRAPFKSDNQANQLLSAGYTFVSYAEGLPGPGSKVCSAGRYARKHAPWTNFSNVPAKTQQPYTSFPGDYAKLGDVSWVIPDMCHDMHDCSVATGDRWLKDQLGGYAAWAQAHHSLLVVTFDEDDYSGHNQIATVFYGADVAPGSYNERITHYSVLATVEEMYDLPRLGGARSADPITDVWR